MIKTILVSLNNIECVRSSMRAAVTLSQRYDCHIIGLFVVPSVTFYSGPMGLGASVKPISAGTYFAKRAEIAKPAFEKILSKHKLRGEWKQVDSHGKTIPDTITQYGHAADLVIIGHRNPGGGHVDADVETSAYIVKAVGRPVLVVPHSNRKKFVVKRAILGWDGSREASRAAFDAIPLLHDVQKLTVTCVNPRLESDVSNQAPGQKISAAMNYHAIPTEIDILKTHNKIGLALVKKASASDLLIIGAYGHSRLRETILGGVTETVLNNLSGPVLLSN
ncbi:MAG: universal stress protein [Hyphomonadaceae bacterium]|nr:universal stress protein [Hyphomonadaceae bacterium]